MTPARTLTTGTYALVSEPVEADFDGPDWLPARLLGSIRLRSESAQPVFVGIGPADAVERYLAGVPREEVRDPGDDRQILLPGADRPARPAKQRFWVAQATGSGDRAVHWKLRQGDWRAVVMSPDGSRGVRSEVSIGARVPDLGLVAAGVLGVGALLLAAGGVLLFLGARRRTG